MVLLEHWRDLINGVGLIATLSSLWLTYRESRKARSAAEAAEAASYRAVEQSREAFRQYSLGSAVRVLVEVKHHTSLGSWLPLTLRLSDLAGHLSQVDDPSGRSRRLCEEARQWESTFRDMASGRKSFPRRKWAVFLSQLQLLLDELHDPFPIAPESRS